MSIQIGKNSSGKGIIVFYILQAITWSLFAFNDSFHFLFRIAVALTAFVFIILSIREVLKRYSNKSTNFTI